MRETAAPREFYHSFNMLGLSVRQRGGIYPLNQRCKEQYILGYLLVALAKARGRRVNYRPSVLELFCADAYYATLAKRFGAGRVVAIDKDQRALEDARTVRDALGMEVELRSADLLKYRFREAFDVVLCTGGLYHLEHPEVFLRTIRRIVRRYLVVQSVVTIDSADPGYFVAPAPGWRHGCRFSAAYFLQMLGAAGFDVLGYGFNYLEGNRRSCDRGSVYALCGVGRERWPAGFRGMVGR